MQALVLVNRRSGNCANIEERIARLLAENDLTEIGRVELVDDETPDIKEMCGEAEAAVCCGGDGTLNCLVNNLSDSVKTVYYLPCGTFNDMAGQFRGSKIPDCVRLGALNDRYFSYVAATGTFTPIGYNTNKTLKKNVHRLAYFLTAFKEYRVWRINAQIDLDGALLEGEYTLIMFLKSKRVFGFNFNRLYNPEGEEGQALLIRAPKGPFAPITLFFRFFRAFFLGFRKEYKSKNVLFKSFRRATIKLAEYSPFCVDGELYRGTETALTVDSSKKSVKLKIY